MNLCNNCIILPTLSISLAWPDRFFRFSLGWWKKGLVWFTVATRLGTFEALIIDLGL